ncbi:hypothetical protein AGABI1DRAFT_111413 [Agaricus bisporus var. burnettii JB137-S8]|uniref:Uncharacterized protein n=1 Tax=Agaricus bisporus var. burnettii (strain JB137-S8 / ATCC MYA-4627 / FGSC 10392) TaxID=597362 RepID=K5XHS5_AGABU|nr:uncharacterized protein AGABI1DRAFT_111413 [Agaricus bisporus var. burnettii JB137-S8]EKM82847.1 hypothetical protein AGABI1DRAFT_111413 [Agaricus bisporus var. burnettii JB137-S8]
MTAAIMDTLDAQMADYQNDFDVPMHVSSSDAWLQDMAPMEDDAQLAFQSKLGTTDTSPTIEVDMEAYIDDGHVEYDMVDDHPGHNLTSGELLDVDVLPVSAMHSPFIAVTALPSVEYPPPSVPAPDSNSPPLVSEQNTQSPTIVEPTLADPSVTSESQADTQLPEVERQSERISTPEAVVPHDHENVEHTIIPTTSSEVPADQTDILHATNSTMLGFNPETDEVPSRNPVEFSGKDIQGGPFHLHLEQETTGPENTSNADMWATHDQLSRSPVLPGEIEERVSGGLDPKSYVDDTESYIAQDPLSKSTPLEAIGETFVDQRPPSLQEKEIFVVQGTEVSAEVFNEPPEEAYPEVPPPILLAIFSNDHPELCLFNKVSDPLPNEDDSQERHILLQTSPNLYYEPLVHVFEALRQDEYISTVLEISGNELALEAYDLELAITEDNFYAREISLHDFYFLHTSASIAGSLRLRLYISGPRFFVRYHTLQGLLNPHLNDSRDSGQGEIEKPLEEQEDTEVYAPETASGAEKVHTSDHRHLEKSKGLPDQPEEGGEERVDGYHQGSHTASEGTVTESGEIDLSTLPPFIDSPEADGEEAVRQDDYSNEAVYPTATTPDNASTGDNYTQDDERRSEEREIEEPENDAQEHEERENEEQENEEQENSQSVDSEDPDLSRIRSPGIIPVEFAGSAANEANNPSEENKADRLKTSYIVEGAENGEFSHTSPREHTANAPQPEHDEGAQDNYLLSEPMDKNQHQEANDEGISFETPEGAYREAETIADAKEVDYLDETWDDELDGEGDPDTTWEAEPENVDESISNESSVTLSSKASKRSFNESGLEYSDEENFGSESPGAKRARVV